MVRKNIQCKSVLANVVCFFSYLRIFLCFCIKSFGIFQENDIINRVMFIYVGEMEEG